MYRSQNQQELTKFQKNEARILAKPISELWNLSMTLEGFPDACEIAKPLFRKAQKQIHQITDQNLYCLHYLKSLKELFLIKQGLIRSYYMTINLAIRRTIQEIHLFLF